MSDWRYVQNAILILHMADVVPRKCYWRQFERVTRAEDIFYFERTSSPVWFGFLQGAPLQVGRFGHLYVQPRQGSNSADCVGEAVMVPRFRFKLPASEMIADRVDCCQRYPAISE